MRKGSKLAELQNTRFLHLVMGGLHELPNLRQTHCCEVHFLTQKLSQLGVCMEKRSGLFQKLTSHGHKKCESNNVRMIFAQSAITSLEQVGNVKGLDMDEMMRWHFLPSITY